MDAALITGMLGSRLDFSNQSKRDVLTSKDSDFKSFLDHSMKKENAQKTELRKKDDKSENVEKTGNNKIEDKKNDKIEKNDDKEEIGSNEEIGQEEKTELKENSDSKEKNEKEEINGLKINGLINKIAEQTLTEDVEFSAEELKNVIMTEVEKEGMILTEEEMSEIIERLEEKMLEKVDEVGPQSVETEKITLNKQDEIQIEEKDKNSGENSRSFDVSVKEEIKGNEEATEPLTDMTNKQDLTEEKLFNKEEEPKKETKMKVTDLRKNGFNDGKDLSIKTDVKADNLKDINIDTENKILDNNSSMQETIDIIEQVAEQVDVTVMEDKSEMVIRLKPDHLGKVTMQISVENGNVTAKFLAESQKVKEILEANFQNLKDMLNKQGMSVQNLSVSVGNDRQNQEFESRRYGLLGRRSGISRIDSTQVNSAYGYETSYSNEQILKNYYPDSTVSFSA